MTFVQNRRSSNLCKLLGSPLSSFPNKSPHRHQKQQRMWVWGAFGVERTGELEAISKHICHFTYSTPPRFAEQASRLSFLLYQLSNSNKIAMPKAHALIMTVLPVILSWYTEVTFLIHPRALVSIFDDRISSSRH